LNPIQRYKVEAVLSTTWSAPPSVLIHTGVVFGVNQDNDAALENHLLQCTTFPSHVDKSQTSHLLVCVPVCVCAVVLTSSLFSFTLLSPSPSNMPTSLSPSPLFFLPSVSLLPPSVSLSLSLSLSRSLSPLQSPHASPPVSGRPLRPCLPAPPPSPTAR